eukprot:gnl/TRDRNA2_/TRDRNA2_180459_c0_seq1.p1 gnl/TRDRNA2_/TRDRNA2_180459_c0~~gnl/TRDRNA2_/TRDRNA2_180459_c0_seq1.p1  ORF type:complete len:477 (-),score=122.71 gnl/TRDRNA2_/TRDRNA2_180459_c0_seq1:28-1458(-)
MASKEELRSRFEAAGQGHVFKFLDDGKVSAEQEPAFLAQLADLDLEYVAKGFRAAVAERDAGAAGSGDLSPPEDFACLSDCKPEDIAAWEKSGLEAVGRGEVAACVLAGGQGTRLGFDGPKGCYNIGLPSGKPIFQIIAERALRLANMAKDAGGTKAKVTFLVMTSPINHTETEEFFASKNYFGLPKEDVMFFTQGTLPCLTSEGKIILESAGCVATAPDGNGGIYPALSKTGCLQRLKDAGVKYLHVLSVDNVLCRPADPRFIGYCLARNADCGNKCVWKASPEEKVGVVALKDGKSAVVEYVELDDARKNQRNDAGRLVFGAGNICNHFYTLDFLSDVVMPNMSNFFHLAEKKIPHAGEDGATVKPTANNGIKLESFIFDVFPLSQRMAILETAREEEFAPVKNAPGAATDSPDTARAMISALSRRWVTEAGGKIEGSDDAILEVSPLLSYSGEGLAARCEGQTIAAPCHMAPQ